MRARELAAADEHCVLDELAPVNSVRWRVDRGASVDSDGPRVLHLLADVALAVNEAATQAEQVVGVGLVVVVAPSRACPRHDHRHRTARELGQVVDAAAVVVERLKPLYFPAFSSRPAITLSIFSAVFVHV